MPHANNTESSQRHLDNLYLRFKITIKNHLLEMKHEHDYEIKPLKHVDDSFTVCYTIDESNKH